VGRKASGPVMMGSGVVQRLDKSNVEAHSFKEWAFFFVMHANNTVIAVGISVFITWTFNYSKSILSG